MLTAFPWWGNTAWSVSSPICVGPPHWNVFNVRVDLRTPMMQPFAQMQTTTHAARKKGQWSTTGCGIGPIICSKLLCLEKIAGFIYSKRPSLSHHLVCQTPLWHLSHVVSEYDLSWRLAVVPSS